MLTMGLLTFAGLLLTADPDNPSTGDTPRKPHPFAPSLPELTEDEEKAIDAVIDRFILYDTGKLTGAAGKQALRDFQQLGPDATFALIRGMNRAAEIEHSCPALVIARKLAGIFKASTDTALLEFARQNIGAGVKKSKHLGVLKDLKFAVTQRKNQLERSNR